MNIENFIQIVTSNPIYLSIAVILSLLIAYSFLKKLFKLLLVALSLLVLFVTFCAVTGIQPTEVIEEGSKMVDDGVEFLQEKFIGENENKEKNDK